MLVVFDDHIMLHSGLIFRFQAGGQISQRVYLATQLFSNTVGKAMGLLLPRRQTQSKAILTIDKWYVADSNRPFKYRLERCAYGASTEAITAQQAALRDMESLIKVARKSTLKQPNGRTSLLPFQHGILRGIRSLRGLHAAVADGGGLQLPDDVTSKSGLPGERLLPAARHVWPKVTPGRGGGPVSAAVSS